MLKQRFSLVTTFQMQRAFAFQCEEFKTFIRSYEGCTASFQIKFKNMCLKERTKNKIEQKLYALNSLMYWRHGNLYNNSAKDIEYCSRSKNYYPLHWSMTQEY